MNPTHSYIAWLGRVTEKVVIDQAPNMAIIMRCHRLQKVSLAGAKAKYDNVLTI
eukprot:gene11357-17767_t